MNILNVFSSGQLLFLIVLTMFFVWSFLLSLIACVKDCVMECITQRSERKIYPEPMLLDKLNNKEEETDGQ